MHRVLGLGEKVLDHTPESATDNDADKEVRVQALKEYIAFLCPSLISEVMTLISVSSNKRQRNHGGTETAATQFSTTKPVETVSIVLHDQGVDKRLYKLKKDSQLQIVFDNFAEYLDVPVDSLSFRFDGERILGDVTPRWLDLEDGDIFEVSMIQSGC